MKTTYLGRARGRRRGLERLAYFVRFTNRTHCRPKFREDYALQGRTSGMSMGRYQNVGQTAVLHPQCYVGHGAPPSGHQVQNLDQNRERDGEIQVTVGNVEVQPIGHQGDPIS